MFKIIEEYILQDKSNRQSHLKLNEDCIDIGTNSQQCRALLAHFLKTTVPQGYKVYLCHACHNAKCSNPRHLYWGTPLENNLDIYEHYGCNPGAESMRGRKFSHTSKAKEKIRAARKGKQSNNKYGINQFSTGTDKL